MAKWRPSWISLGGHRSWTNWPILTNLTFLSLSRPAEKNHTNYYLYFTKNKKDEFFDKAILALVRLGILEGFSTNFFFCLFSISYIKWYQFRGSPFKIWNLHTTLLYLSPLLPLLSLSISISLPDLCSYLFHSILYILFFFIPRSPPPHQPIYCT